MNRYEQGTQVPTVRTLSRLLEPMGYRLEIVPIPGTEDKEEVQAEALKEEENEK